MIVEQLNFNPEELQALRELVQERVATNRAAIAAKAEAEEARKRQEEQMAAWLKSQVHNPIYENARRSSEYVRRAIWGEGEKPRGLL